MDLWVQSFITIICSVVASSGFWAYLQRKTDNRDKEREVLIGLGHDRIVALGMYYIKRGYITENEYDNITKYLYEPYVNLGGNGSAARIMKSVEKLPIRPDNFDE